MRLSWTFWDTLGQFGRLLEEFGAFSLFLVIGNFLPQSAHWKKNALRTDRRTDGRTDRPSYRDAKTHLKKRVVTSPFGQRCVYWIESICQTISFSKGRRVISKHFHSFSAIQKRQYRTDGRTDQKTDGWTDDISYEDVKAASKSHLRELPWSLLHLNLINFT